MLKTGKAMVLKQKKLQIQIDPAHLSEIVFQPMIKRQNVKQYRLITLRGIHDSQLCCGIT